MGIELFNKKTRQLLRVRNDCISSERRGLQNRHESCVSEITDNPSAVVAIQKLVDRGYHTAVDIKRQFEISNPSKPKFGERSWRNILAHENLELDC